MEKMAWDGPKWGQEDFFLKVQICWNLGKSDDGVTGGCQWPSWAVKRSSSEKKGVSWELSEIFDEMEEGSVVTLMKLK